MQNSSKARTKPNRVRKFLVLLLLLVLLAIVVLVAKYLWSEAAKHKQAVKQQITLLEEKLDTLQHNLQATGTEKPVSSEALQSLQIKDAILLTRTASLSLKNDNDVDVAKSLLQLAIEQLDRSQDDKVVKAKATLSADLAKLNAVQMPDMRLVQDKLATMDRLVNILPERNSVTIVTPKHSVSVTSKENTWYQPIVNFFADVRNLVRVYKKTTNDVPDTAVALNRAQLKLVIEQLRWAAFYKNADLYQRCIKVARDSLPASFDMNSEITQQFAAALNDLAQVNISPELPNIQDSVNALQALLVG
jgi:uroporphyrin-3 C-methyltransferase